MKRLLTLLVLAAITILVIACSGRSDEPEKINGVGPADIPVKYVDAQLKQDYKALTDLIAADMDFMNWDLNSPPKHPEYEVTSYSLTQWKLDENTYYYLMEYLNPAKADQLDSENFKIEKTDEGWKKDSYGETPGFEEIVSRLEETKTVLKELSSE